MGGEKKKQPRSHHKEKKSRASKNDRKSIGMSPEERTAPPEPQPVSAVPGNRRLTKREALVRHHRKIQELDLTKDEWRIARNVMLKERKYTKYPWFWGMIVQKEAEHFLQAGEEGEFLVRSEVDGLTKFIVSFVHQRTVNHLTIYIKGAHWKLADFPTRHDTLVDLVAHFQAHHMGKTSMRLRQVASKPEWLIAKKKILAPKSAKQLGSGNFSDVIIGAFQRRVVAIKVLTAQDKTDLARERDNMMHEFNVMNRLQNPYVTKAIGVMLEESPPMLLMEMMATTLDSHLNKYGKSTSLEEKLLYCWQMAKGLEYMAEQKFIHRDVAARNALFSRFGILKIADFGLSDQAKNLVQWKLRPGVNLPMRWMAPEVYDRVATYTEKSDVWSFGVCCNEIFQNGLKPADYIDDNRVFQKLWKKDRVNPHQISKSIPDDVRSVVTSCWDYNPEERPAFRTLVKLLDFLIKHKYPPPLPEDQTVRFITHCRPLTICEYEALYYSNSDWLEPVRKAPMNKKRREVLVKKNRAYLKELEAKKKRAVAGGEMPSPTRSTSISKKKRTRNPFNAFRRLEKTLRRRRTRRQMRLKLDYFRHRRREDRRRTRLLTNLQMERMQGSGNRKFLEKLKLQTRIIPKYERLVQIYWKLSEQKYRKVAPTRQTRLRLRKDRQINRSSTLGVSRNGKDVRIKPPQVVRTKRSAIPIPVYPEMPTLKTHSVIRPAVEEAEEPRKKKEKEEKTGKKEVVKRRRRQLKRRAKRRGHNEQRQKQRKKRRAHERARRRRKMRRRFRRLKRRIREEALSWEQKDRMEELIVRRRERQRRLNRRHRDVKIGRILSDWKILRRKMVFAVDRRVASKQSIAMKMQMEVMNSYPKEDTGGKKKTRKN